VPGERIGLRIACSTLAAIEETIERDYGEVDADIERALSIDPRHSQAPRTVCPVEDDPWRDPMERWGGRSAGAVQDRSTEAWVAPALLRPWDRRADKRNPIAEAERSIGIDPDSFFAHMDVMRSDAWAGHYDRAFAEAPALLEPPAGTPGRSALAHGRMAKAGHCRQGAAPATKRWKLARATSSWGLSGSP